MAGITERKMTSEVYDNSRSYTYFTKVQNNENDIHSNKAMSDFKRPLFHLGKGKETKNER